MKSRFACSFIAIGSMLMISGCSSTRKADDNDYWFRDRPRTFGERVSDWWDRSREREDRKFERMFDRATR